eukprot:6686178-Lingulodinium_polyedra.AAC.1
MAVMAPLLSTPSCCAGASLPIRVPRAALAGVRLRRPRAPSSVGPFPWAGGAGSPRAMVFSPSAMPSSAALAAPPP